MNIIDKIKHYCHKVLPLTYDDSLSYYEVLCKLTGKVNEIIEYINTSFIDYVKEVIGDIFVESTYDSTTKTLDFSFDDEEHEEVISNETIANISVNNYRRALEDAYARGQLNTVAGVGQSNLLIVAKRNARFSTINSAIDYAKTYCTPTNRVTIVIIGGYNVVYQEYIDLDDNPGIDFVGIGNPILQSSVAWRLSTLRCSNSITVDGIWFENYYTPGSGEYAGYGLHADPVTGVQNYRNCRFYSNNNQGVGIGMGSGGSITFENCYIVGTEAVYVHNRAGNGVYGQWVRFFNCRFEARSINHNCIKVYDAAVAQDSSYVSQMGLIFANCVGYPSRIVSYIYDGTNTIPYIPSNGRPSTISNTNIYLVGSSICPGIPGVDYYQNIKNCYWEYMSFSNRITYVPFPNASRYTFVMNKAEYYDTTLQQWVDPLDYSSIALTSDDNYPDMVRVDWPGAQPGLWYRVNFKGIYYR